MQCIKSPFETCFCYLLKSHVEFSFGTKDVRGRHHDAKKIVQQIVQEQQEKSRAIYKARHDKHRVDHQFQVGDRVSLQITKERMKGKVKSLSLSGMVLLRSSKRLVLMLFA